MGDSWPMMLDMSRDDCKRVLRRLELEAYSNLVSVLRAQGSLTPHKRRLLQTVAQTLSISEERHKAECRRAVNSEKLATIAKYMGGSNTGTEWAIEGRRLVPLLPRLVPQTAFTAIADQAANSATTEGAKLPLPIPPARIMLSAPPVDEVLLEPSIPEASRTVCMSSLSPLQSPSASTCAQSQPILQTVQSSSGCSPTPQALIQSQAGQIQSQSQTGPVPHLVSLSQREINHQPILESQIVTQGHPQDQTHVQPETQPVRQAPRSHHIQAQAHNSPVQMKESSNCPAQMQSKQEINRDVSQKAQPQSEPILKSQIQLSVQAQLQKSKPQLELPAQSQTQHQVQLRSQPQLPNFQVKQIVKPLVNTAVKPAVKSMTKPVVKTMVKPVAKVVANTVTGTVANTVANDVVCTVASTTVSTVVNTMAKSMTKAFAKPVPKPVPRPVEKPVAKPVPKPVVKPMTTPVAKPLAKPVSNPLPIPVAKPVNNSANNPVNKPLAKSLEKPLVKPVVKSQNTLSVHIHEQSQVPSATQVQAQVPTQVQQFPQSQASQASTASQTTQGPLLMIVKKEDDSVLDNVSRKRPRSASFDAPFQELAMPPPAKKEALQSPQSPCPVAAQSLQSPGGMSPQSHSQMVQQQTLQAAAAAAAAAAAQQSPQHASVPQAPQRQLPVPLQQQAPQASSPSPSVAIAPITRPLSGSNQNAVKISLTSPATTAIGSSSTHKVIIVSSTAPSILQRSLSVPVVKTISTSAPSETCTSTVVLNTAPLQTQGAQSTGIMGTVAATSSECTTSITSAGNSTVMQMHCVPSTSVQSGSVVVSSKMPSKVSTNPKARPRANSIVIPVTPNQAGVMSSVAVSGMHLKTALQSGKPGLLKAGDGTGLKIMPIANVGPNAKILPKPPGSGPIYVVSSTPGTSSNLPVVTRTVPSGTRVMTLNSANLPRMAVNTSQSGPILNISSKSVPTLQLTQASSLTSTASTMISSSVTTPGKQNVIVVQKGVGNLNRGVTLSHSGKEVLGKVVLGGKALTSLNQSQMQVQIQSSSQVQTQVPCQSQLVGQAQSQPLSQTAPQTTTSQNSAAVLTSVPTTRMVTMQKLPSTVVSGTTGTGNVLVFDLTPEQLNSSAVIGEILASGVLSSNNIFSLNQDSTLSNSRSDSAVNALNPPTRVPPSSTSIDMNGSTIDELKSSNAETYSSQSQPSTIPCSDIFTTAISSANLNLTDFLEDSSLDDLPPADGMRQAPSSVESSSSSSHSNYSMTSVHAASWAAGDNSQNSIDVHGTEEV